MMGQVEDEDDEGDGHADWSNADPRSNAGESIPYEWGNYNPTVNWYDDL